MKKINWHVRFQNKKWVAAFISQILIIAQIAVVGMNQAGMIDFVWTEAINSWVLGFSNAVLVALSMLGIVQDPTSDGYSDQDK